MTQNLKPALIIIDWCIYTRKDWSGIILVPKTGCLLVELVSDLKPFLSSWFLNLALPPSTVCTPEHSQGRYYTIKLEILNTQGTLYFFSFIFCTLLTGSLPEDCSTKAQSLLFCHFYEFSKTPNLFNRTTKISKLSLIVSAGSRHQRYFKANNI